MSYMEVPSGFSPSISVGVTITSNYSPFPALGGSAILVFQNVTLFFLNPL